RRVSGEDGMPNEAGSGGSDGPEGAPRQGAPWPMWKKISFVVAALLLAGGALLRAQAAGSAPGSAQAVVVTPTAPSSERPDGGAALPGEAALLSHQAAPTALKRASAATGATQDAPARDSRLPVDGGASAAPPPSLAQRTSPILIESGLSFFVGFCVAAALRAIARTVAILVGVVLLGYFALQYAGVVEPIAWGQLEESFATAAASMESAAGHVWGLVAHALPSGTMAGLGLAAGFKKR
ncbi:FUN14 domain-containing protein, partial [Planctomycetota bacterium]